MGAGRLLESVPARVGTSTATTCGELRTAARAGASGTPTWRRCLGRSEGARRPGPGSASAGVRLDLLGPGACAPGERARASEKAYNGPRPGAPRPAPGEPKARPYP